MKRVFRNWIKPGGKTHGITALNRFSFAARFGVLALFLLATASLLPETFFAPLNHSTAAATGALASAFGLQTLVRGDLLFTGGLSVRIISECTPIFMVLLFISFVLAFPASPKEKAIGLVFGIAFLVAVNTLRLLVIIGGRAIHPAWLTVGHAYLGQIGSILAVLAACLGWVRFFVQTKRKPAAAAFFVRFLAAGSILFLAWIYLNKTYVAAVDVILRLVFSLFNYRLIIPYNEQLYYETFNLAVFAGLILADGSLKGKKRRKTLILGGLILFAGHIALRFLNVLITGFALPEAAAISRGVHILALFVLPLCLWMGMGGEKSLRLRNALQRLRTGKAVRSILMVPVVWAFFAIGGGTAEGQGFLLHQEEIFREFAEGKFSVYVIVNLKDSETGRADLSRQGGRAARRERVRRIQDRVIASLDTSAIQPTHRFVYHSGFAAEVTRGGLEQLLRHPEVGSVEPDRKLRIHTAQGIPLMKATDPRNSYGGSGTAIAIVDTGVDYNHPKLGDGGFPNSKVIGGYDFGGSRDFPAAQDGDPMDDNGHGTSCAGIAAGDLGTAGDYIGGVAPGAKLYAVKVTHGTGGEAYTSDLVAGWEWCITHQNDDPQNPILVISTSLGGGRYAAACDEETPSLTQAAANAAAAGITLFISAGNDGFCDGIASPACLSHAIAVGAVFDAAIGRVGFCVDPASCAPEQGTHASCAPEPVAWTTAAADKETPYSNTASILGLFAPSHNAYTTAKGGGYTGSFGGTSAACPYAAGAASVLQNAAKVIGGTHLTPGEIRDILIATGDPVTAVKYNYSKSRVNLETAVNSLFAGSPEPVPALSVGGIMLLFLLLGIGTFLRGYSCRE